MASTFAIEEHTFEGQHIREHARSLASSQEDVVKLHAKSYTPHSVANGSDRGDLTFIAFHANAFHKEVYEPFFEALYHSLKDTHSLTISSIWIADQAAQGTSGLLNDHISGNDPSWWDHARDILAMSNAFRRRMQRPIIGLGHSMGGTQAVATAHMHPRLFEALVLIDAPVSLSHSPSSVQMLQYALRLPEAYDSREAAERAVRQSPLFHDWDPRVVRRYIDTAFHAAPTATVSDPTKLKPTTTKHAEISTLVRSQVRHPDPSQILDDVNAHLTRASQTPVDPHAPLDAAACDAQPKVAWTWLPSLRPSTLYVHGEGSRVTRAEERAARTEITGTAPGGSGGVGAGRVRLLQVAGGHFAPMTNVEGTAETVAGWVREEMGRFRGREAAALTVWGELGTGEKQRADDGAVARTWWRWDGNRAVREGERKVKSRL